jgi:hypothetical protein
MSQKFILIENPGVAPVESFTLLGASNKAGSAAIGQFGSGTKFGTLSLLRKGIRPLVYCGNLSIDFGTKPVAFNGEEHSQVFVRLRGQDQTGKQVNRTEDLSVVLRYGEIDWKDKVELALREFVSNALDAVQGDASQVRVEIVDKIPRAKAGHTRVYIALTDEGESFVKNIADWFLHFSQDKVWHSTSIIFKDKPSPAKIYRRGVFVREVRGTSLFDYNLNGLPLDEARVADDWSVKAFAEKALNRVSTAKVVQQILLADKGTWEASFDLTGKYDWTLSDAEKTAASSVWKEAQDALLDDKTIFISEHADSTLAEGKGYKVVRLNSDRYDNALAHGLRTVASVLTTDEREGRKIDVDTDVRAQKAVLHVWNILVSIDATKGEQYPEVRTYTEHNTGGGVTFGLWKDNTVFVNTCLLGGDEISPELFAVCLEELAHHITKATDNSRGFQEYFIQTLTKVLR